MAQHYSCCKTSTLDLATSWQEVGGPRTPPHSAFRENGGGHERRWRRQAQGNGVCDLLTWQCAQGASTVAWGFYVSLAGGEAHCGSPPYIPGVSLNMGLVYCFPPAHTPSQNPSTFSLHPSLGGRGHPTLVSLTRHRPG